MIQKEGGTIKLIEKVTQAAQEMVAEASILPREPCPITELIMGTGCSGSDPTSGVAANPVIGELSDYLVTLGATSILSETPEFIGAEHILSKRAKKRPWSVTGFWKLLPL